MPVQSDAAVLKEPELALTVSVDGGSALRVGHSDSRLVHHIVEGRRINDAVWCVCAPGGRSPVFSHHVAGRLDPAVTRPHAAHAEPPAHSPGGVHVRLSRVRPAFRHPNSSDSWVQPGVGSIQRKFWRCKQQHEHPQQRRRSEVGPERERRGVPRGRGARSSLGPQERVGGWRVLVVYVEVWDGECIEESVGAMTMRRAIQGDNGATGWQGKNTPCRHARHCRKRKCHKITPTAQKNYLTPDRFGEDKVALGIRLSRDGSALVVSTISLLVNLNLLLSLDQGWMLPAAGKNLSISCLYLRGAKEMHLTTA
ncbi:hypothetical protein FB451DRAFT_1164736 [Mycena latifolia]|nr:hypothetical protein FB451DRAFT_1164736 [Mycena latifolia]